MPYKNDRQVQQDYTSYYMVEGLKTFYNHYLYEVKPGCYTYERNTIQNVLRHLRNAVCHDKLSIYPLSDELNREVTHLIFRDTKNNTEDFYMKIEANDLFYILSELVSFYEKISEDNSNITV